MFNTQLLSKSETIAILHHYLAYLMQNVIYYHTIIGILNQGVCQPLTTYRSAIQRYFLERSEGERFDIGEDDDLNKKLASKRKQLKSIGKGNLPNRCDSHDEEQIEKLWSTGAIGTKTPRQLLHLVW
jgi:hypothetical protein